MSHKKIIEIKQARSRKISVEGAINYGSLYGIPQFFLPTSNL